MTCLVAGPRHAAEESEQGVCALLPGKGLAVQNSTCSSMHLLGRSARSQPQFSCSASRLVSLIPHRLSDTFQYVLSQTATSVGCSTADVCLRMTVLCWFVSCAGCFSWSCSSPVQCSHDAPSRQGHTALLQASTYKPQGSCGEGSTGSSTAGGT